MNKYLKLIGIILIMVLSIQQIAFASMSLKPTVGIESATLNSGSSEEVKASFNKNINTIMTESNILITDYSCKFQKDGSRLYVSSTTTAMYLVDYLKVTLYLQEWNGSEWIDIKSWTDYKYNEMSIDNGYFVDYTAGNYYRVRAVHYAKDSSQTNTKYSTSSYSQVN